MMKKVEKIICQHPFVIRCFFNNGEERLLNLEDVLDRKQKFAKKIFKDNVFKEAKVGSFGQVYWENIAEIKTLEGKMEPCEYDLSPEFVYMNSQPV